jgi:hypothetical protein
MLTKEIVFPGGSTVKPIPSLPDIAISANNDPINGDGSNDPAFMMFWVGHFVAEHHLKSDSRRQLLPNHNLLIRTLPLGHNRYTNDFARE